MVMRLVGEEATLCLKKSDSERLMRPSTTDGTFGFADLNPKVWLFQCETLRCSHLKGPHLQMS